MGFTEKNLGVLLGVGALMTYGYAAHVLEKAKQDREFNHLAAGLTMEQRALADRFWKAGIAHHEDVYRDAAVATAALEDVEAVRVALDRLGKSIALHDDPTCHPQVAEWLCTHWSVELVRAMGGNPTAVLREMSRDAVRDRLIEMREGLDAMLDDDGIAGAS